jgi:rhodanese-related sulfurtransferase
MKKRLSSSLFPYLPAAILLFAVCSALTGKNAAGEVLAEPVQNPDMATAPAISIKQIIHPEVLRIPASEAKELLAKKADIVVVDVNPKDFFDSWHIPSAINIPYSSMDGGAQRERKLKRIPVGKLIVLYCLCEEGADSSEEALELRNLGHARDKVKVLEGGLIQWDAKGYPIYKQKTPE